jgi:hypothetical protein
MAGGAESTGAAGKVEKEFSILTSPSKPNALLHLRLSNRNS